MRRTPVLLAAGTLILGIILCGCSAVAPRPTPTAPPTFTPVYLSGTSAGEKVIPVPAKAHSAEITVACSGASSFSLDGALNKSLSGLNGYCNGGIHRYVVGVQPRRALDLTIELTTNGEFVLETRFSSIKVVVDGELSQQCSVVVTVASDAFNAEDGYTRGKVSLAQWRTRVAAAAAALRPLEGEKTNILSAPLAAMRKELTANAAAPGAFLSGDYEGEMSLVRQVCSDNGSATYITAEFGG